MAKMRDSERGTLVAVLTVVCIAACATHVDGAPGFRHLLVPRWETPLTAETQTSYYTNQPNTPFISTNRRGTILGKYDGKLAVANNEQAFSTALGMHLRYHIRLLDVDTGRIVSHSYYATREASWIEPQSVVMYPGATSADPGTMLIVCGLVGGSGGTAYITFDGSDVMFHDSDHPFSDVGTATVAYIGETAYRMQDGELFSLATLQAQAWMKDPDFHEGVVPSSSESWVLLPTGWVVWASSSDNKVYFKHVETNDIVSSDVPVHSDLTAASYPPVVHAVVGEQACGFSASSTSASAALFFCATISGSTITINNFNFEQAGTEGFMLPRHGAIYFHTQASNFEGNTGTVWTAPAPAAANKCWMMKYDGANFTQVFSFKCESASAPSFDDVLRSSTSNAQVLADDRFLMAYVDINANTELYLSGDGHLSGATSVDFGPIDVADDVNVWADGFNRVYVLADDGTSGVEVFEWDEGYNVPVLPNGVDPGSCRKSDYAVINRAVYSTSSGLYFAGLAPFTASEDTWVVGVMNYSSYTMRLLGYPPAASHRRQFEPYDLFVTDGDYVVLVTHRDVASDYGETNDASVMWIVPGVHNVTADGVRVTGSNSYIHHMTQVGDYLYWIAGPEFEASMDGDLIETHLKWHRMKVDFGSAAHTYTAEALNVAAYTSGMNYGYGGLTMPYIKSEKWVDGTEIYYLETQTLCQYPSADCKWAMNKFDTASNTVTQLFGFDDYEHPIFNGDGGSLAAMFWQPLKVFRDLGDGKMRLFGKESVPKTASVYNDCENMVVAEDDGSGGIVVRRDHLLDGRGNGPHATTSSSDDTQRKCDNNLWMPNVQVLNADNDVLMSPSSGPQSVVRLGYGEHIDHDGVYGAVRTFDDFTTTRSPIMQVGATYLLTTSYDYYDEEGTYVVVDNPLSGDDTPFAVGVHDDYIDIGMVDLRGSGDGADWTYVPFVTTPCDGQTFALFSNTPLGCTDWPDTFVSSVCAPTNQCGCEFNGECVPVGTEHPTNPCFECNPINPTLWTKKSTLACAGACPILVGPDTPYWPVYADRKYDMMRPLPKAKYTARDCAGLNTLPVDA